MSPSPYWLLVETSPYWIFPRGITMLPPRNTHVERVGMDTDLRPFLRIGTGSGEG